MREYLAGAKIGSYSYTMHSSAHKEADSSFPEIKFSYDLSPMKVRASRMTLQLQGSAARGAPGA